MGSRSLLFLHHCGDVFDLALDEPYGDVSPLSQRPLRFVVEGPVKSRASFRGDPGILRDDLLKPTTAHEDDHRPLAHAVEHESDDRS